MTVTITWLDSAACLGKGSELFFADSVNTKESKKLIAQAKAICDKCPVVAECLQYAINNDEGFGVWGSFSAKERRIIKNHLNIEEITLQQAKQMVNRSVIDIKSSFKNTIFVEERK